MTIEDLKKHPELEKEFRTNSKKYAATEIAYITRFLKGDKTISKNDFSSKNLEIIKKLQP